MNDAMTDSHRVDAKLVAQPFACDTHRGRMSATASIG